MEFVSWGYDISMESHSKFHGSSHQQAVFVWELNTQFEWTILTLNSNVEHHGTSYWKDSTGVVVEQYQINRNKGLRMFSKPGFQWIG